jgi:dTDP-4-amino-4,6-dideoxygalactose transaminase
MNIKLNDLKAQWELIKEDALPEIEDFLSSGHYVNSPYVKRFEEAWSRYSSLRNSIMVSSGTDAYKVCLQSFQHIPEETCVLLQNNSWASILFVTKSLGYNYEFIDCDEYLQYSVSHLQYWLKNTRTRYKNIILVPTHILGHPCDMKSIFSIAKQYDCKIIEDCSQSHGAEFTDNNIVGSYGDVSFWSCFPGKNLGGVSEAGIISTLSDALALTIKSLINCGMYEKYKFSTEGSNHRPSGLSAIVLYHKLKYLDEWNTKRAAIADRYSKLVKLHLAPYCKKHVYHYYYFSIENRDAIIKVLNEANIPYNINYPFTLSEFSNKKTIHPHSEDISTKIICIPCHPFMTDEQVDYIIETLRGKI